MNKKILLRLIPVFLAISGIINLGNEVKAQSTCATAVTKVQDTTYNLSTYNITTTAYWIKFTAISKYCFIEATPSMQTNPSAQINNIYLYSGTCSSLVQLGHKSVDSLYLTYSDLIIGSTYYIKVMQPTATSAHFDIVVNNYHFYDLPRVDFNCNCIGYDLVFNGDFSLGYTGFYTDYYHDTTFLYTTQGLYSITTDAQIQNYPQGPWYAYGHGGSGNFIVFDYDHYSVGGPHPPKDTLWYQQIDSLKKYKDYVFSFWVNNLDKDDSTQCPSFQMHINGALITLVPAFGSPFTTYTVPLHPVMPDTWYQVCGVWNSGDTTKADFVLNAILTNPIIAGEDLGIDDIQFALKDFVYAGRDTTICEGSCVALTASGANTYLWSDGSTTNPTTVCPSTTTIYYVTGTAPNGCTAIDTVVVNVIPAPAKPNISGQWNTCHVIGGIVTTSDTILNWNPAYSYVYFIGANGTHIPITSNPFNVNWTGHENGGMLYVEVTDTVTNCTNIDSLQVFDCCKRTGSTNCIADIVLSTPNAVYNGEWFVNGYIIIDANTTLGGGAMANIYMGPNAKIIINAGKTLTINNASILRTYCDTMWDGIYINGTTAHLIVNNNSSLINAKNAIVSQNGGDFQLTNTVTLENNYRNIVVNQYAGTHPGKVSQTTFKCTSALKTQIPLVSATRTYSGIEIENVDRIVIGDTTAYSKRNTFDNMEFGIRSIKANIFVYNNRFLNINAPSTVVNPPTPPFGTAVGILGARNSSTNATIGGTNASGYFRSNTFNNCYYGIHCSGILNTIKAENDTMVTQTYSFTSPRGIFVNAGSINSTTIRYNKVTNGAFGIQFMELAENKSVNISSNNIVNSNTGISVTNVVSATPYTFQIANNIISKAAYTTTFTGIQVTNINGISHGIKPYAFISTNTVTFSAPSLSYTAYGIRVQNCPKTRIELNTVTNSTTTVPTSETQALKFNGIQVELSSNAYLCSNNVTKLGCGLRFVGSMPGSTFYVNTMNTTYYGVRLDGANVGAQGTASQCNGNQWLGTQNKRLQGTWTPNYWYYYGSGSMSLSVSNVSTAPSPNGWLISASNYLSTCSTITPQMLMVTVNDIVNEQYVYTTDIAENKYTDNVTAYTTLKSEPTLLSSLGQGNNKVQSFLNIHDAGNIGKFYKVNNFTHSGNLNAALAHNKAINPSNTFEINMQKVNDVYLNTWANGKFEFTEDEYSTLYNVAIQNPILGGSAVYSARVMIGEFETASNLKTTNPSVIPTTENMAGLIYPNPVTDNASIDYTLTSASNAQLVVYSITGKQIAKYELNVKDTHFSFNTTQFNAGIYFYQLIANGELISYNKFIIIN